MLIENQQNTGFSKANNQAVRLSKGQYILLLNPDTIIEENTFEKCLGFMDSHPDAGGLGVKMIDGKGNFLPESKRSLPTPMVAFWKIFGFASLFPRSRIFGKYHLGYLDKDKIHAVDILSGAFMMLRRETLEKTGVLDETFFMYGEDIDLSWRIIQAGYHNYYFPDTTIIHYKGESTRKSSLNYVYMFYNAMIIFARKHFSTRRLKLFSAILHWAIWIRASLSAIKRLAKSIALPLLDGLFIYMGFSMIQPFWASYRFEEADRYPPEYLHYIVPSYILIWLLSLYYSGAYEKPVKLWRILRGIIAGTLVILVIYALLPSHLRFSRAMILMGTGWALISLYLYRFLLHFTGWELVSLDFHRKKKIVIAGSEQESMRVENILKESGIRFEIAGFINPEKVTSARCIGHIGQLQEIVRIHHIDEIIFCARDVSSRSIIENMLKLSDTNTEFKIAPEESISIIGSNSINSTGELYVVDYSLIARPSSRRMKRLLDISVSFILLVLYPFIFFLFPHPVQLIKNILFVFCGKRTWVGYIKDQIKTHQGLPVIREGILSPADGIGKETMNDNVKGNLNLNYARDYKFMGDLHIIVKAFRHLDRK